jgi:hypothetical protein
MGLLTGGARSLDMYCNILNKVLSAHFRQVPIGVFFHCQKHLDCGKSLLTLRTLSYLAISLRGLVVSGYY